MSWTTPRSWVAGEFVTASMLNTHIRDNETYLFPTVGNWTPIIGGSTSQSGQTYSLQHGTYIKIGRLVLAWGRTTFSAKGTITGFLMLKGLPFAALGTTGTDGGSLHVSYFNILATAVSGIDGVTGFNTTDAALYGVAGAGGTSIFQMTTADLTNTSDLIFNLQYITTANP